MTKQKRRILLGLTGVCVAGVVLLSLFSGYGRRSMLKYHGEEVRRKIEQFQGINGRLPGSLEEIGIRERDEGPIYYKRKSASDFILWFGEGLGSSYIYDSETETWREAG